MSIEEVRQYVTDLYWDDNYNFREVIFWLDYLEASYRSQERS